MSRKTLYIQSPEGETLMLCSNCKRYKPCNEQHFAKKAKWGDTYLKDCIACRESLALRKAHRDEYRQQLEGFVYFVADRTYLKSSQIQWFIKIGWTTDPKTRFGKYKPNGILLGMVYGIFPDEKSLQDLFAYKSARYYRGESGLWCEWFFLDDALLDFIQDVAQLPIKAPISMMEAKDFKQQFFTTVRSTREDKAS